MKAELRGSLALLRAVRREYISTPGNICSRVWTMKASFCCDAHSGVGIGVGFGGLGKSLRMISLVRNGGTPGDLAGGKRSDILFGPSPPISKENRLAQPFFDRRGDVWIRGSDLRAPDGPARPAAKKRI